MTTDLESVILERARYLRGNLADLTVSGYANDWKFFAAWCASSDRAALPASEDTVSLYLTSMLLKQKKVSTVCRHASAIAYTHRKGGIESPVTREIRVLLRNARRLRCEPLYQMRAITLDELRQLVATLAQDGRPRAVRDASILTLGFFSALRRSSLARLELRDLEFTPKGLILQIRNEKWNRAGVPRYIGIPHGIAPETCAVKRLRAWLDYRGKDEGTAVYTKVQAGSHRRALKPNNYWQIVKRSMRRAGLDAEGVGSHSLRASFVTAAFDGGAQDHVIGETTGHHDLRALRGYYRRSNVFRSNACEKIGL